MVVECFKLILPGNSLSNYVIHEFPSKSYMTCECRKKEPMIRDPDPPLTDPEYIEDITWQRGDTKFLLF